MQKDGYGIQILTSQSSMVNKLQVNNRLFQNVERRETRQKRPDTHTMGAGREREREEKEGKEKERNGVGEIKHASGLR